jgi:hypothetical protein
MSYLFTLFSGVTFVCVFGSFNLDTSLSFSGESGLLGFGIPVAPFFVTSLEDCVPCDLTSSVVETFDGRLGERETAPVVPLVCTVPFILRGGCLDTGLC